MVVRTIEACFNNMTSESRLEGLRARAINKPMTMKPRSTSPFLPSGAALAEQSVLVAASEASLSLSPVSQRSLGGLAARR
ncbi:MAG: hypothetical protein RIS38_1106 [Verrucomicrobiota bacterium]|jgi:hypothetical protein